ncbi:MAG TPA: HIRAN domain-containing protein [Polyangiaceae bacterium]|nr:HIRAN domain-containing protein [Polyangiaceae bacterium]
MQSWGVTDPDNPLEVLARSGGIQMTDRIELAEHRPKADDLRAPLLVRIAGMKKHAGAVHIQVGDTVTLMREPDNAHDEKATMIVAPGGEKAGYVPRQYSETIATLLDEGVQLEATAIRQLGVPADVGRWVVRLARRP